MKRVLAFLFGLVLTLSIARVGNSDSISGYAHICSSTGKLCLKEIPIATSSNLGGVKQGAGTTIAGDGTLSVSTNYLAPGSESPRTIYFAKYLIVNLWSMSPGNGDSTSSHAQIGRAHV